MRRPARADDLPLHPSRCASSAHFTCRRSPPTSASTSSSSRRPALVHAVDGEHSCLWLARPPSAPAGSPAAITSIRLPPGTASISQIPACNDSNARASATRPGAPDHARWTPGTRRDMPRGITGLLGYVDTFVRQSRARIMFNHRLTNNPSGVSTLDSQHALLHHPPRSRWSIHAHRRGRY